MLYKANREFTSIGLLLFTQREVDYVKLCTETLDIGTNSKKTKQKQDYFKIPPIAATTPIPPDVPACM